MPYPNEHSCRLREPGTFQAKSFRRIKSGKLHVILGRLKGQSNMTAQAYRYPVDDWSTAEARAHCKEHDGTFELASNAMDSEIRRRAQK